MNLKFKMMTGAALSVLALAPAVAAHAQAKSSSSQIGEVIVTATKTGVTQLQKTPISIAVVSDVALKNTETTSIRDLPNLVSGLKLSTGQIQTTLYIRGVGGFNAGEGDVSIYMDGVYLGANSLALGFNFNDVDRIEVLKGPQGTLYGRNSTGGALNLISKTPTNELNLQNTATIGNYNLLEDQFYVSGPLIKDKVTASFAVDVVRRDGYLKNIVPSSPDLMNANRLGYRGQLRWQITPDIVDTVRADSEYTNEHYASAAKLLYPVTWNSLANTIIGNFHKVATNADVYNREAAWGVSNDLSWTINSMLTAKSVTAYREDRSHNAQDGDATEDVTSSEGIGAWGNTGYFTGAIPDLGAMDVWEHQFSEEFNLLNKIGPFSGVAGLYYYNEYVNQIGSTIAIGPAKEALALNPNAAATRVGSPRDTRIPVISQAAFFEETYHVTPRLGVSVGARYTEERKVLDTYNLAINLLTNVVTTKFDIRGGAAAVNHYHAFTPKFGVNYQVTDDAMVYASATKGFKSGGYSSSARSLIGASFGQETLWSYEVGAKTDWFDHRLRVNLAAFRNDWQGLQFSATISNNPPVTGTSNAAAAYINGLEADITAKPDPTITLTGSVTLLDAKYVNFKTFNPGASLIPYLAGDPRFTAATAQQGARYDASGKTLVEAPPVSLIFTGQKDFNFSNGSSVYVRGEYQYTALTYFQPSDTPIASQPAFSLYNASIGYEAPGGHWQVALWGKNLSDQNYVINVGLNSNNHITAPIGLPRTFGARITYNY
jgi:iron complex outermembrane receptor protein